MSTIREGKITRVRPRFVTVDLGDREVRAVVKGELKTGPRLQTNVLVVGDQVRLELAGAKRARVVEILPRRNRISRVDPGSRKNQIEHVLAANLDWFAVVVATREPPFNPRTLDRLLVIGELAEIPAVIILSKVDLDASEPDLLEPYREIGYLVVRTSAKTGQGRDELLRLLEGKTTLLSGPSGGGKSSLLNMLIPDLELPVGEISESTGKGIHTTTRVEYIPIPGGGAILDSPGIRSIQPWGLERSNLAACFPELRERVACYFRNCSHRDEPDCEVKRSLERGEIHRPRYDSYLRILEGLEGPEERGRA